MRWEVCGAERANGRDQTLIVEADDKPSAVRRATRHGLVVEWARPLEPDDSLAGAAVAAEPAPAAPPAGAADAVSFAYVAPSHRRRRKKKSGGSIGLIAGAVALLVVGLCVWGWQASQPALTATPTSSPPVDAPAVAEAAPRATPSSAAAAAVFPRVVAAPRTMPVPSLHVSAGEMLQAIAVDKKLAESGYAGRTIAVDGRAETVGQSLFGTPSIAMVSTGGAGSSHRVVCTFSADDAGDLTGVAAGDTVTVVGQYDNANGGDAQLVGCRVLTRPTASAKGP